MSIPKEDLHRLVDLLPEKAILIAKRFMESIILESRLEDINWLNAELADWPPYDWGPEGVPKGKPVRFMSEEQLREEINRLVNRIPIEKLEIAIHFLKSLLEQQQNGQTLANPSYDDEPWTEEDEQAVAEAEEDMRTGRIYTLDEVEKELGL
ncbi:MAG: hypothetical protein ACYCV0_15000 [Desulfitobacteriaceae bacterium]